MGAIISKRADKFLNDRGLDVERAHELGWRSDTRGSHGSGYAGLAIPYLLDGEVVNHKYRSLDGKSFSQDPEAVKCLWNGDVIGKMGGPLVVVEGEMDALAMMTAGVERVVSVPDGAPSVKVTDPSSNKYDFLRPHFERLQSEPRIILAVDNDQPGQNLFHDLKVRLGEARCWFVRYPRGCKDANEVLLQHGTDRLRAMVEEAMPCDIEDVFLLSQMPPLEDPEVVTTGIPCMDKYWKVARQDFIVVTGIPGCGKTLFVNSVACHLAQAHGWRIGYSPFEQHPTRHLKRELRHWHLNRPISDATEEQIEKADAWIDRHFVITYPKDVDREMSLDWWLGRTAQAVLRYGLDAVILDPWNELEHVREIDETLTEYVARAIRSIKRFGIKYNVTPIVVAHPHKVRSGDSVGLYSISDSAHWANKCDVGIVVERDGTKVKVKVKKVRFEELVGKPGTVDLIFEPYTRRYQEDVGA